MKKGLILPILLCANQNSMAFDYSLQPIISSSERYTSNIYMSALPHQDNWITKVSPGVNFGIRNEDAQLTSNFTFNQLFYTNQSALDINEQLFSIDYNHRKDRWQWGLDGSFNNQSSLSSSYSNQGTVLGYTLKQVMVKQLNIAPSLTYALSELSSATLNYTYTQATYDKNTNRYLSNYDYQQVSGTYNYLYTVNNKLNLTLSGSQYNKPLSSSNSLGSLNYSMTTTNDQASLGWQHTFPKQWVSYLSVGMNYSQSDLTQIIPAHSIPAHFTYINKAWQYIPATNIAQSELTKSTTGTGQIYQASIQKSFERATISLVGSQNQTPTTQGLQTQTQISVNPSYTINERWNTGLSASYAIYKMPTQINGYSLDRDYTSISPNINWRWTPEINIGLSYTYREQVYKNNTYSAQDNGLLLQLTYQPQINNQVK